MDVIVVAGQRAAPARRPRRATRRHPCASPPGGRPPARRPIRSATTTPGAASGRSRTPTSCLRRTVASAMSDARARRGRRRPGPPWARRRAAPAQTLRIVDLGGNQAVDCLLYDADDTAERYSARRHDRRPAATSSSSPARCCCSNEGAPMMTVTDTTCAYHDTIGGACSRESNTLRYGHHTAPPARLRRQLPRRRARATGSRKRDLVSNINWFMNVPVGADGTLGIVDGISAPGLYVDLRAEMDVLVLISNCPQINNPCNGFDPTPVRGRRRARRPPTVTARSGRRRRPPAATDRGARRRRRSPPCRTCPGASGTGTSASRRTGRWTTCPTASSTGCVGNARRRRRARAHRRGPDAALRRRRGRSRSAARAMPIDASTARRCRRGRRSTVAGRRDRRRRRASTGPGLRATLGVRGGIDVAAVPRQPLDVHARQLRRPRGPRPRAPATCCRSATRSTAQPGGRCRRAWRRRSAHDWELGVLVGPHTAPEFLTADGLDALLRDRRGRCTSTRPAPACGSIGPKPRWARADGGEAGLHPSNIHDTGYAIGAVDLTGDMPVILGPDGPSLGGFVCPAVVAARRAVEARPARARRPRAARAVVARRRPRAADAAAADWLDAGHRPHRAASPARRGTRPDRPQRSARRRGARPRRGRPTTRPRSPTARPATGSCSSSTAT